MVAQKHSSNNSADRDAARRDIERAPAAGKLRRAASEASSIAADDEGCSSTPSALKKAFVFKASSMAGHTQALFPHYGFPASKQLEWLLVEPTTAIAAQHWLSALNANRPALPAWLQRQSGARRRTPPAQAPTGYPLTLEQVQQGIVDFLATIPWEHSNSDSAANSDSEHDGGVEQRRMATALPPLDTVIGGCAIVHTPAERLAAMRHALLGKLAPETADAETVAFFDNAPPLFRFHAVKGGDIVAQPFAPAEGTYPTEEGLGLVAV